MEEVTHNVDTGIPPQPSRWLRVGSGLAIATAILFVAMCLSVLLSFSYASAYGFMSAIMLGPMGLVFAYLQYRAVYRRRKDSAMFNGIALILFSAFTVFCVITNVGEAMIQDDGFTITPNVILIVICVLSLFAVLPLYLGISTFRWSRALEHFEKSEPLCSRCEYSLRGTIASGGTECPECGEAINRA